MKKIIVVAGVLAAAVFVIFAASNVFAWGVPSSVGDAVNKATKAPADQSYNACKAWANQHKNNMSYNSTNIEGQMTGKEFSNRITEKDWRKGGSKYDTQNKRLDFRATYSDFTTIKLRCNKDKCSSIYCNKN